jgi:hypothetical protein
MLIKLKINKQTLEWTSDDESVVMNHFIEKDDEFEIEISKPDPELQTNNTPWQQ